MTLIEQTKELDKLFVTDPDAYYQKLRADALREVEEDEKRPASARKRNAANLARKYRLRR